MPDATRTARIIRFVSFEVDLDSGAHRPPLALRERNAHLGCAVRNQLTRLNTLRRHVTSS